MLDVKNIDIKLREYKKIAKIYEQSSPDNERFPMWLNNEIISTYRLRKIKMQMFSDYS